MVIPGSPYCGGPTLVGGALASDLVVADARTVPQTQTFAAVASGVMSSLRSAPASLLTVTGDVALSDSSVVAIAVSGVSSTS